MQPVPEPDNLSTTLVRNKGHVLAKYSARARALKGPSTPSRKMTYTFSQAASSSLRVENNSLIALLNLLDAVGRGSPGSEPGVVTVEWLVTSHDTGSSGHTTTALKSDGLRAIRAAHGAGVI